MAQPIRLHYAQRDVHVSRIPEFSELNIKAAMPFRTSDGTWGCAFQLDVQGTIRLETVSNGAKGSAMVVFVGTKQGVHQVVDMVIDRTVSDGVITIPRGLTEGEVAVISQQFKVIGAEKQKEDERKKNHPAPKKGAPGSNWAEDPAVGGRLPTAVDPNPKKKPDSGKAPGLDLPRVAD